MVNSLYSYGCGHKYIYIPWGVDICLQIKSHTNKNMGRLGSPILELEVSVY